MVQAIRLGVISDAHGNIAALMQCLRYMQTRSVDSVLFLGDAVGYFPHAGAVTRLLMRHNAQCVMGNHDAMLLGRLPLPPDKDALYGLKRIGTPVSGSWQRHIERVGPERTLEIAGVRLLLVHGTPGAPLEGYGHDIGDLVSDKDVDCILTGHTHRPHLHHTERALLLNPGSCGLPRDRGDLLSLAILDLPSLSAEIIRLPFACSDRLRQQAHPLVRACLDRRPPAFAGTIKEFP
ncbi:metallophosphoesterase family protein [Desulfovibrio psychrotolerans]|uniref:Phosphoesterase n=1 Tax=Desulfovibrio psychrotolerans TaxID=415242 RepID=A0A7J0BXX4_9BACT|nr:YfcE family phosphodiesterase [Desulfovibrio psychrotolerans]GFM38548.1 phosphoesterase [Desulfovibrio psychrotolerans]